MSYALIYTGLGLATAGYAGKLIARISPSLANLAQQKLKSFPNLATYNWKQIGEAWTNAKYHRGGFEQKMSKREAFRILGVSPSATKESVGARHKRIMLQNHPDRGGSPYLAAKINEAKDTINKL